MLLKKLLFNSIHDGLLRKSRRVCKLLIGGHASLATSVPYDILQQGLKRPNNRAIKDATGSLSYGELLNLSVGLKEKYARDGEEDFSNIQITFLTPNDISYVATKLSIWLCNSTAVPLSPKYPLQELEYVIHQSCSKIIIAHPQFKQQAMELSAKTGVRPVILPDNIRSSAVEAAGEKDIDCLNADSGIMSKPAMILYTSGTTGQPKGVLMNHLNLAAQVGKMLDEWEWEERDNILHVLPLHHTHGIVNALLCPLVTGAQVTMEKSFDAKTTWDYFLGNPASSDPLTLFMAVPTIYSKLIQYYDDNLQGELEVKEKFESLRLMVSGSAALPVPILEKWRSISGHLLLERYGMTEFGMGLTNPYRGERKAGCVGLPFPYTEVKIVGCDDEGVTDYNKTMVYANEERVEVVSDACCEGELLVRSPSVFHEYFNNPTATEESFHHDWFKTGDTCTYVDGSFRVVGRSSVDIIKSGGYKIGALEIEAVMLQNPLIQEIAVLGVPDPTWGEVVAAVIAPAHGSDGCEEEIVSWCRDRMPSYRIPRRIHFVPTMPRNAMGKVNKKQLLQQYFATT